MESRNAGVIGGRKTVLHKKFGQRNYLATGKEGASSVPNDKPNKKSSSSLETPVAAFGGAFLGAIILWIGQGNSFSLTPDGMSYTDLAAILLTAVGVIVAIFGGVLALAAIWGFNQLKKDAVSAAGTEVREQIENGKIRDYIEREIGRLSDEEFNSERMDQRIQQRVDAVAFGRPEADKLLEEGDE